MLDKSINILKTRQPHIVVMRCEVQELMSNNENKSITPMRKYIAIGYAVIAILIGGIIFIYLHEW